MRSLLKRQILNWRSLIWRIKLKNWMNNWMNYNLSLTRIWSNMKKILKKVKSLIMSTWIKKHSSSKIICCKLKSWLSNTNLWRPQHLMTRINCFKRGNKKPLLKFLSRLYKLKTLISFQRLTFLRKKSKIIKNLRNYWSKNINK